MDRKSYIFEIWETYPYLVLYCFEKMKKEDEKNSQFCNVDVYKLSHSSTELKSTVIMSELKNHIFTKTHKKINKIINTPWSEWSLVVSKHTK